MPATIIVQADKPRALAPEDVATALACSLAHVYRLIEGRKLLAFNLAPDPDKRALYRIPLASFQRFLQDAQT